MKNISNKRYVIRKTTYCFTTGDTVMYYSGLGGKGWTYMIGKAHHYTSETLAKHTIKQVRKKDTQANYQIQVYMVKGTSMYI